MSRQPERILTLADLIQEHKDKTGDSYGDMARLTGLSRSKIGQLARPENTYLVRHETLTKLARGLRIPYATVERASLGTAGFTSSETPRTMRIRAINDRLDSMPESVLALVAGIIETVSLHEQPDIEIRSRREGQTADTRPSDPA